jgi:hypothetical protein
MESFLHIYLRARPGTSRAQIEAKLDLALDWVRYDNGLYVVYTTSDVDRWYQRLSPLVKPGGRVFICELDLENRQGWMSKGFWAWVRKYDEE